MICRLMTSSTCSNVTVAFQLESLKKQNDGEKKVEGETERRSENETEDKDEDDEKKLKENRKMKKKEPMDNRSSQEAADMVKMMRTVNTHKNIRDKVYFI